MKIKTKKCAYCKVEFFPQPLYNSTILPKVCSTRCAIALAQEREERKSKAKWAKEKKMRKEAIMSQSEWLKTLQVVFNTFIRMRDKGKPCISCGRQVKGNGHASHFFSVGAYPNLRFNEDNVWVSCIECNVHRHGNTAEYAVRLRDKLGEERFNKLLSQREIPLKLTKQEIQEKIKEYKQKTKDLCRS